MATRGSKQPASAKKKRKRYRDDAFLKRLGRNLRRKRVARGYSIDRVYLEGNGLNRATISRMERGMIDPQISTLKRFAETIGVPLSDLMKLE